LDISQKFSGNLMAKLLYGYFQQELPLASDRQSENSLSLVLTYSFE